MVKLPKVCMFMAIGVLFCTHSIDTAKFKGELKHSILARESEKENAVGTDTIIDALLSSKSVVDVSANADHLNKRVAASAGMKSLDLIVEQLTDTENVTCTKRCTYKCLQLVVAERYEDEEQLKPTDAEKDRCKRVCNKECLAQILMDLSDEGGSDILQTPSSTTTTTTTTPTTTQADSSNTTTVDYSHLLGQQEWEWPYYGRRKREISVLRRSGESIHDKKLTKKEIEAITRKRRNFQDAEEITHRVRRNLEEEIRIADPNRLRRTLGDFVFTHCTETVDSDGYPTLSTRRCCLEMCNAYEVTVERSYAMTDVAATYPNVQSYCSATASCLLAAYVHPWICRKGCGQQWKFNFTSCSNELDECVKPMKSTLAEAFQHDYATLQAKLHQLDRHVYTVCALSKFYNIPTKYLDSVLHGDFSVVFTEIYDLKDYYPPHVHSLYFLPEYGNCTYCIIRPLMKVAQEAGHLDNYISVDGQVVEYFPQSCPCTPYAPSVCPRREFSSVTYKCYRDMEMCY